MKLLFVGHSHLGALVRGWQTMATEQSGKAAPVFVNLKAERFWKIDNPETGAIRPASTSPSAIDLVKLHLELETRARNVDCGVYVIAGNQHNVAALRHGEKRSPQNGIAWSKQIANAYVKWIDAIRHLLPERQLVLLPPPPIESEAWIQANAGALANVIGDQSLLAANKRLELWHLQCDATRSAASRFSIPVHEFPAEVLSPSGFLAEDCRRPGDSTHANQIYGRRIIESIWPECKESLLSAHKGTNPYKALGTEAYWSKAVSAVAVHDVDPVGSPLFRLHTRDRVATAGSCFAQHISRRLKAAGFTFLQTEQHKHTSPGEAQYEFSARYGNVYTSRQLVQLFDRAFGYFRPIETAWLRPDGRYCDPFRPRIEPLGYTTQAEVERATEDHLTAVKEMFCQVDVLVFTLGLTECFANRLDGSVFPLAPGVAADGYDKRKHIYLNLCVNDVIADLTQFVTKLTLLRPAVKVILTVSPVPLVATQSGQHVLTATTYSKSVLRVAAAEVERLFPSVCYFPSYEIITGAHAAFDYFEDDRRTVTERGVDHVMRVFMSRMTEEHEQPPPRAEGQKSAVSIAELAELACDEELLDANLRS